MAWVLEYQKVDCDLEESYISIHYSIHDINIGDIKQYTGIALYEIDDVLTSMVDDKLLKSLRVLPTTKRTF